MSLKSITIEVRKNLFCANVYLQFNQSLADVNFVKIHVDQAEIELREELTKTIVPLEEHFTIQAQTLSSLVVDENNASFRITIDNLPETSLWLQDDCEKLPKIVPRVQPMHPVTLSCCSCQSKISRDGLNFSRILEYPSGSIDVGEFFCHHGPDLKSALVPRLDDLFYGFHFVILNNDSIKDTRIKDNNVYCRRCLRHLGEIMFNGQAIKIWTDSINESIFGGCDENSVIGQLLIKILEECCPTDKLHIMQLSKTIIETVMPSREKKYILLNILEKNLDILRNTESLIDESNNSVEQIKLAKFKAAKVFYQLHDDDSSDLLESWIGDISVHSSKISPTLFTALYKRLEENSLLLPKIYRYSNEFILSYLFY